MNCKAVAARFYLAPVENFAKAENFLPRSNIFINSHFPFSFRIAEAGAEDAAVGSGVRSRSAAWEFDVDSSAVYKSKSIKSH